MKLSFRICKEFLISLIFFLYIFVFIIKQFSFIKGINLKIFLYFEYSIFNITISVFFNKSFNIILG